MQCPKCGEKVKVINSRTVESAKKIFYANAKLIEKAQSSVGWYTPDWVARHRRCTCCSWEKYTVEVTIEDFEEMRKIIEKGELSGEGTSS